MAIPYVKIHYENGALGLTAPSPDGLLAFIANGVAVSTSFELNKPYLLSSFDDLITLGINESNNPAIVKLIRDFYAEAGSGTNIYLMAVSTTETQASMLDYTNVNGARKLMEVSNGTIRGIITSHNPETGYTPVIEGGINADVYAAIAKGQELGDWAAETMFAPIFIMIEGRDYQGDITELRDLTQQSDNRVGVLIGDTVTESNKAAMGLLAGRIAKIPVQRNIGRVADGALNTLTAYIDDIAAELVNVGALHDKGFISFRNYTGRSGYFFTNDMLATLATDDYRFLTYRRTIDKAYRISYITALDFLLDEIPITADGKLLPGLVKSWQGIIEDAIANQMTSQGELSANPEDPNDRGVKCYINENQNVLSTGKLAIQIRVRPFAYARYVDVYLGFTINNNNNV